MWENKCTWRNFLDYRWQNWSSSIRENAYLWNLYSNWQNKNIHNGCQIEELNDTSILKKIHPTKISYEEDMVVQRLKHKVQTDQQEDAMCHWRVRSCWAAKPSRSRAKPPRAKPSRHASSHVSREPIEARHVSPSQHSFASPKCRRREWRPHDGQEPLDDTREAHALAKARGSAISFLLQLISNVFASFFFFYCRFYSSKSIFWVTERVSMRMKTLWPIPAIF